MNINQQLNFMAAAANPFPLRASFSEEAGGGYKCKLCGAKMKDQNACADHLLAKHREMEARDFSENRRKSLAKSGKAMPGGGFPIVNREDLKNAKQAIGRAKNPAAARRHINERAKALGAKPIGMAAYGTSEGVTKAWESRGRKQAQDALKSHGWDLSKTQGAFDVFKHGDPKFRGQTMSLTKYGWQHSLGPYIKPTAEGQSFDTLSSHLKKIHAGMDAQVEFSPSMRLRMPKKAGQDTMTQNPQYTGGTPDLRAKEECDCQACSEQRKMEALGMKHHGMGKSGCGSHGFALHKGSGYAKKADKLGARIPLSAYGTSEGVEKEWDTRGRSKERDPVCGQCGRKKSEHVEGWHKFMPIPSTESVLDRIHKRKAAKLSAAAERPVLIRQRPAGIRRKSSYAFRGYQAL